MIKDIRIIALPDPQGLLGDVYDVAHVTYDNNGEITETVTIFESDTMAGALGFLDQCYRATLKPVLVKDKEGVYE
jgi:hypothetical protein